MSFPDLPLLVLDTETTGFVPKVHRVIEFAAAQISKENIREYETLFSIPGDIPPHVEVLTRIRTDDLKEQPTFTDKKSEIEALLTSNTIIVGQNIGFDIGMLRGEGLDLTAYETIDTSLLASVVFPEFASYSLGYMTDVLELDHTPKHRALGDVRATVGVLKKCLIRLSELPKPTFDEILALAARGPKGYKLLFESVESIGTKKPAWLTMPSVEICKSERHAPLKVGTAERGTIELVEESLDPAFVEQVLRCIEKETPVRHFVAVKNLEALMRRIDLPKNASILHPPHFLLDEESRAAFLSQAAFTVDELILAMKLLLYRPSKRSDAPLHGADNDIWEGKLACALESPRYIEQIENLGSVVLVDHKQLLMHIEMKNLPPESTHVIFDDASMLEDAATRAYGWFCNVSSLRRAAEGNIALTKFTDLLQLWIEKTRSGTTIRYLTTQDIVSRDAEGLHAQLEDTLQGELGQQARSMLENVKKIIDPLNIGSRINWIEVYKNGDQCMQSVPANIATLLNGMVFTDFQVTLLIPPKSETTLGAIIPRGAKTFVRPLPDEYVHGLPVMLPLDWDMETWARSDVTGKNVLLIGSRRTIEDLYVRFAEDFEARGIAFFAQGVSGGQKRMQAEFAAAKSPAILAVTPWNYEGFELPTGTVDRLFVHTLPFDHPSHAVIAKRCEQFKNPFNEYSLPRLMHRMFRLLRTFMRHKTADGSVSLLDARLHTKEYGKVLRAYLSQFSNEQLKNSTEPLSKPKTARDIRPQIERKKSVKRKAGPSVPEGQQSLF